MFIASLISCAREASRLERAQRPLLPSIDQEGIGGTVPVHPRQKADYGGCR